MPSVVMPTIMPENDDQHRRGEQRLEHEPERPEDGLLVARGEVALDEHGEQIAVLPELAPRHVEPAAPRLDDDFAVSGGG